MRSASMISSISANQTGDYTCCGRDRPVLCIRRSAPPCRMAERGVWAVRLFDDAQQSFERVFHGLFAHGLAVAAKNQALGMGFVVALAAVTD